MQNIKVFEAFAGYGSQAIALKKLEQNYPEDIKFEYVGISEINKYAIQAYTAIHGEPHNYGDISTIDWSMVPDFDLFTYSFPCTDISKVGRRSGMSEGSGTFSSLLWECKSLFQYKHPKYLLLENVKTLLSKKYLPELEIWFKFLLSHGYISRIKVLDSIDYGIPQHRERVFMVSVLNGPRYDFPKPIPLKVSLSDLLESNIPSKYYLGPAMKKYLFSIGGKKNEYVGGVGVQMGNLPARCLTANYAYSPRQSTYIREGRRIRKLTNRECFRLMGVKDKDIDKIDQAGISMSQQYIMAGNSIVVNVLYYIFEKLFIKSIEYES